MFTNNIATITNTGQYIYCRDYNYSVVIVEASILKYRIFSPVQNKFKVLFCCVIEDPSLRE